MHEVVNRRPLTQELRVGDHRDVRALHRPFDDVGGAHGNGRLVDHDRFARQVRSDFAGGLLHVGQVGPTVVTLGGGNAEVSELAARCRNCGTEYEAQLPRLHCVGDDLVEAGFEDGDLPGVEHVHLGGVDVGADDIVAEVCETGARGETDVAGSDHRHLAHSISLLGSALPTDSTPSSVARAVSRSRAALMGDTRVYGGDQTPSGRPHPQTPATSTSGVGSVASGAGADVEVSTGATVTGGGAETRW